MQQYGNLGGTSVTITGAAANAMPAARESTQLEIHLNAIRSLHEALAGAAQRAKGLADRLLGAEPENINKDDIPKQTAPNALLMQLDLIPKQTAPNALLMQLDLAQQTSDDLAQSIHYHLNRLERL